MKLTDTKIYRYEDGDYNIDISDNGYLYEAYIGHDSQSASYFVLGRQKSIMSLDEFVKLVAANLEQYKRGIL